ncbi:Uncharacterised protein [uncultured Roseburia sp.]|uniref:Uncharacterized protein n=1 Tax=Brotonthovivens ammoniilytica TaxID=2981725 RepID=A0ABT2TL67_9FIRM|nr:hypothetical protein [Brotonthovivens ammoniilytica]MCU6762284.1 hypothetical protein [Brotonthovivens ammoniilytica]SCI61252.1 Uncharacterised protein [uncultured Roseburia sp.]
MTKHDAMKAYFEPKVLELAGDLLTFNFSPESPDSIAFVTNYSDKVLRKNIRVGSEKEYGFSIIITREYSTFTDDLNLKAMNFAQAFMDWLDSQDKIKSYPEFPDNCQIKKIENLQNMPNLAGINAKEGLARYMLQCRVVYFEKER